MTSEPSAALPPVGCRVSVCNVRSRPALNGRGARVVYHDTTKGRCGVLVDGETAVLSLSNANLVLQLQPNDVLEGLEEKCMRMTLCAFAPGDRIITATGAVGTIEAIHARVAVVRTDEEVSRSLLRDCELLCPTGRRLAPILIESRIALGHWPARHAMDAAGNWAVQGGASGRGSLERDGVHWLLHVGLSDPLPAGLACARLELELDGMDQGWGNSGDSGVLLSIRRAGVPFSSEPILRLVYDRARQRSRSHRAAVSLSAEGAPRAGDRIEVQLQCPNYPGWSAHCERVALALVALEEQRPAAPPAPQPLPDGWREQHAGSAFERMWVALKDDARLAVDGSHLSLEGLQQQRLCASAETTDHVKAREMATSLPARLRALLVREAHHHAVTAARRPRPRGRADPPRYRCLSSDIVLLVASIISSAVSPPPPPLLRPAQARPPAPTVDGSSADAVSVEARQGATRLVDAIARDAAERGADASSPDHARTARALRCAVVAHETLEALEAVAGPLELLPTVALHWGEAQSNCIHRWERELAMMRDLATGRARSAEGESVEDALLRLLLQHRRTLAEQELHAAKRCQ